MTSPERLNRADASTGEPPIGRPVSPSFPEVPLSYSALASYRECPARFFATRVLKLDEPEHRHGDAKQPLDPEMEIRKESRCHLIRGGGARAAGTAARTPLDQACRCRKSTRGWRRNGFQGAEAGDSGPGDADGFLLPNSPGNQGPKGRGLKPVSWSRSGA